MRRETAVIVTRPEEDAMRLISAIEARGMRAVNSPLMTIEENDATVSLDGVAALAFTSANGVRAFEAKSDERGLPAFAVGGATGDALKAAGFRRIYAAAGDVVSLADLIKSVYGIEIAFGAILHLAGTHRKGDLVKELNDRAVPAARTVIYEATPAAALAPAAIAAIDSLEASDAPIQVAFFSPRTARLFVDALRAGGRIDRTKDLVATCLSANVAAAAQAAIGSSAWREIRIAEKPTATALIDALER
ncbi:MAG: uroporphyrinogen-III synthase [Pseudomonadota bacterium]